MNSHPQREKVMGGRIDSARAKLGCTLTAIEKSAGVSFHHTQKCSPPLATVSAAPSSPYTSRLRNPQKFCTHNDRQQQKSVSERMHLEIWYGQRTRARAKKETPFRFVLIVLPC